MLPEQLLFLTTSDIPGADRDTQCPQLGQPQVSLGAVVTAWPQADLSEEQNGVPGEVVTTEEPARAGAFTPLPHEGAPWDALGHL